MSGPNFDPHVSGGAQNLPPAGNYPVKVDQRRSSTVGFAHTASTGPRDDTQTINDATSGKMPDTSRCSLRRFSASLNTVGKRLTRFMNKVGREIEAIMHGKDGTKLEREYHKEAKSIIADLNITDNNTRRELTDRLAKLLQEEANTPTDEASLKKLEDDKNELQADIAEAALSSAIDLEESVEETDTREVRFDLPEVEGRPLEEVRDQSDLALKHKSRLERAAGGAVRRSLAFVSPEMQMKNMLHIFAKNSSGQGRPSERRAITDNLAKCYTEIADYKKIHDRQAGREGVAFASEQEFKDYLTTLTKDPPPELSSTFNTLKAQAEKSSLTLPLSLRNEGRDVKLEKIANKLTDAVFNRIKMEKWKEKLDKAEESINADEKLDAITQRKFDNLSDEITKQAEKEIETDPDLLSMLKQLEESDDPYELGLELLEQTNKTVLEKSALFLDPTGKKGTISDDPKQANALHLYFKKTPTALQMENSAQKEAQIDLVKAALEPFDVFTLMTGGTQDLGKSIDTDQALLQQTKQALTAAKGKRENFGDLEKQVEDLQVKLDAKRMLETQCSIARGSTLSEMQEIATQFKEGTIDKEEAETQLANAQVKFMEKHDEIVNKYSSQAFEKHLLAQGNAKKLEQGVFKANRSAEALLNNAMPLITQLPAAGLKNTKGEDKRQIVEQKRKELVESMSDWTQSEAETTFDLARILAKVDEGLE